MKKLRLLLTAKCNRACPGCCNNDWDLDALPKCEDLTGYDQIMVTGGEPLLEPKRLLDLFEKIRKASPSTKIYLYTAMPGRGLALFLPLLDGVTVTLHEKMDVKFFLKFLEMRKGLLFKKHISQRLNVFEGIDLEGVDTTDWGVKEGIRWIEDCPLPQDEVFMRWDN